jgi:hypothetical protein
VTKKNAELKLTVKDIELLRHVLRTYPAQANLHDDIIRLYDRLNKYLSEL